ncbi:hypothetical protein SNARM312S_05879 [Streptomyces narbonensis]
MGGASDDGQIDPGGSRAVLGDGAAGEELLGLPARDGALRGERDHGRPQRFGPLVGGGLVRVADAEVDGGAEGQKDQQDQQDGLAGAGSALPGGPGPYGLGVLPHPLLGGVLLEAGSADERLVEDDGSVLVLTTAGETLGCPLRRVATPCHTFRVGLRGHR